MDKNGYKVINMNAGLMVDNDTKKILSTLFSKYDKEDIHLVYVGESINTHIKSLDLDRFSSDVDSLLKENTNKNAHVVLNNIISSIKSIKSYGIKGGKRIYVDYDKERKVKNRKDKENNRRGVARISRYSNINNELPKEYEDKIICGDSLELMKKLPDNCVDLIFTSPPYNFGMEYTSNKDDHNWDSYFKQLFDIFDEGIRVLKYGGRFVVNIQPLFSDYIPSHHIVSKFFLDRGMLWKGEILWEKNNYNCKYTSWGSWKSPSSPYLKYTWEFVEVFAKGTLKKEGVKENADISADEFKKWVVAKWSIAPERRMKQFDHPAMFPEELASRVMKLFSFKNDIILDPFNGVGTTTSVAKRLERRYLGIDISKKYCDKAIKRLKEVLL